MADYRYHSWPRAEISSSSSSNSVVSRKKKRKLPDSDDKQPSKSSRINQLNDFVTEPIQEENNEPVINEWNWFDDSNHWRNLRFILSLQDKNLDIHKKVALAYKFVNLSFNQVEDDTIQPAQTVSLERVLIVLNNWVQSTLISSEKKGVIARFDVNGSCLDYKCWKIFKFCLEEATKLHVSLSFARDILKVIHCVAKNTEVKDMDDDVFLLYTTMLDCISSIFISHGGVSNENLDLWISLVGSVLDLVLNSVNYIADDTRLNTVILNFACIVLDPFIKFLRVHPNKKNGFHDFLDRLLEPLLCLLHVFHDSVIANNSVLTGNLLKLIEEVLSQGLFHSSHIEGFLTLQSLAKYKPSDDGKPKDAKTVIKSYHRHLFEKLGRIVVQRKSMASFGKGKLFCLYVHCIKRQERVEVTDCLVPEKSQQVCGLSSETRKSLFDFFVQIMEPFIGDIDTYIQDKGEVGSVLEDVNRTLKSINMVLIGLMQEKVYVRVDDTSEGACANFLKLICDKVTLLSLKIDQIVTLTLGVDRTCKELVEVVAKELVLCVRYLLEIDYEVLGNDLQGLWRIMFSYGTLGYSLNNLQDKSVAIQEILHLGCHMLNLYSDLRQVGTSVFALCKAVRRLVSSVREVEANHSEFGRSPIYHESLTKSLRLILCSPELRLSIHNAVKSIPEGQVSLCIQELATDLAESLKWMKDNCRSLCQEVLGNGLSEVYALILDSLTVTSGNSSLVGVSLNDLITVIRPVISIMISQQSDGVHEFLAEVSGCKDEEALSAHWIFVFFFRLYMSSRSLYRQAVSLAPPTTSIKMSEVMGHSFTAYSGNDWLEKTEKDKGYFSWISQPSASLLLIIERISDIFVKESELDISPLTYVLNAMTIQRLVDLNRLVNSFEFIIKRNNMMISNTNEDGTYSKQNKRLRKCLSTLIEEASGLTNFTMGHLSFLNKCQEDYQRDIAVAAIDKKSFPYAFLQIVCQNIDIVSLHATKKKLKKFLLVLLQNSFPCVTNKFRQFGEHNNAGKFANLKTVTKGELSLELLSNTMMYEEKFVRRHMAAMFCKFLKELVSPLSNFRIDLQAQPNWLEVLNSLKIPSVVSIKKSSSEQVQPSVRKVYTVCESSLSFLSWMPKRCMNSKSFTLYATCILNLERLIVGTLLDDNVASSLHDHHELLRLFLCCRKTLKNLMGSYCEENIESSQNSLGSLHFRGKFPALWLLKSLLSVQHAFPKENDLLFSLMDYTSYVFLILTKGSFVHACQFLISSKKAFHQKAVPTCDQEDSDNVESNDACNFMIHVAEALKDHSQHETTFKSHIQKLSSIIASFQGFMWGLSSTLVHMDAQNINLKAVFQRKKFEPVDRLKLCIDSYTTFINKFLCELVLQDDKPHQIYEKSFNLENVDMDSVHINSIFLHSLLAGENLEATFFLRELFIAYSAVLRLNSQIKSSVSLNLVNIFIGISEVLFLEFSINTKTPSPLTFVFLDGIGKFLEELANHLNSSNPALPTKVYEKFIDMHLKAIGKCISLQQKGATLESHETESSTKTLYVPECAYFNGPSNLDELKNRLRMSLKVFVGKPPELYISSAVKSIKKALVGLPEGCMANYQIHTGKVSSIVAAGIDCLDLVLEAITGRKGLSTVKTDILLLVGCLFNIILHLQGPIIFYKNPIDNVNLCGDPDPGSVVLMCIEVLSKISGKHALYQIDACFVAQALTIPATLFQNILHLRIPEDKNESMNGKLLDRQYSVELYGACCRMLHTFLRHHKRESLRHIALLQASVSTLLHCLEMVSKREAFQKSYSIWGVQEGVTCGAFLRRIYEEIRQQKDFIGQDCRLFLSSYIVLYSGCGPRKAGIRREIDEALKPGVYALIDSCSPDDMQYLHTVLGEGPCRNTLANLQHDYKLNFQYEGKV